MPLVLGVLVFVSLSLPGLVTTQALAAGNCPSGQGFVSAHVRGTVTADVQVCADEVAAWHDLVDPPFRLRSVPGRDPQNEPNTHEALSIRELASRVAGIVGGFSVDSLTYVEIVDRSGSKVSRLAPTDLAPAGENGFESGLMPAVFFQPGFGMFSVRPLRPTSEDVNVNDYLAGATGGALHVYLHTLGTPLTPQISVDDTNTKMGNASRFAVTFDPPETGSLTYRWDFGDGTSSSDASPTHRWSTAGNYRVQLSVSRVDDAPSLSNILTIAVAAATPTTVPPASTPPIPGPSGGQGTSHAPATGPDASQGTQTGNNPGAATVPGTATAQAGEPPATEPHPEPAAPTGTAVSGILLSADDISPATLAPQAHAPARHYSEEPRWSPSTGTGVAAAVLALFAWGGLSESGRLHRNLRRRSS